MGCEGAEAGERQMEHGCPHLLAGASALVTLHQPRTAGHRSCDREVRRRDVLHADGFAAVEHQERKRPPVGAEAGALAPPETQRVSFALR
jgi:hypothetical protein